MKYTAEFLLETLREQSWKLEPFACSDGEDVGWRVVEYHMAEPKERTVAEIYTDDPVAALSQAAKTLES